MNKANITDLNLLDKKVILKKDLKIMFNQTIPRGSKGKVILQENDRFIVNFMSFTSVMFHIYELDCFFKLEEAQNDS